MPLSHYMAKKVAAVRTQLMKQTDSRVKYVNRDFYNTSNKTPLNRGNPLCLSLT